MASCVPLIVVGAGGHGKVVLDTALSAGKSVALVLDAFISAQEIFGVAIAKSTEEAGFSANFRFVVAIGDNATRKRIFLELVLAGHTPETVVHSFSSISIRAEIGKGSVVCAGVVVNACARIGENSILNTGCSVDHDCQIGDHVHICPGVRLAGNVKVGNGTMIGTGSLVIPGITIGERSIVGAGSVVIRDVPSNAVVFGNPAKVKRYLPQNGE